MLRNSSALSRIVGISIGIVTTAGGSALPKDLIARADSALYRAKRSGKNRSCVAEEPPEPTAPEEREEETVAL